jgi:hypothetical protein
MTRFELVALMAAILDTKRVVANPQYVAGRAKALYDEVEKQEELRAKAKDAAE